MTCETQHFDQKSLRIITGSTADWAALAADCVCFANASGGCLRIGVEDGQTLPPAAQRLPVGLLDRVRKRIGELTVNVQVAPALGVAENGGEYIDLVVARAVGVASTADGRYFLRVGDACRPVLGDDVLTLLNDRPQLPWETMRSPGVPLADAAPEKVVALLQVLRASDRVKGSVKDKGDAELLAHYGLCEGEVLTHLGVLLVGRPADRARLGSAPVVQAIKYDELDQKVNKWLWADYALSPLELVEAIWLEIPDFHESYELPDGLLRQKLPAYDPRVVRELLVTRLELAHADELQAAWLGRLLTLGLVQSTGKTQATRYFVAPTLLKGSGLEGKTTLTRMEPYRLRALIVEDLARYPDSSSGDINRRVGPEVPYRSLKRALDELTENGQVQHKGQLRGRRYRLKQD